MGGHLEEEGDGELRVAVKIDPIVDMVTTCLDKDLIDMGRCCDDFISLGVGGSGQPDPSLTGTVCVNLFLFCNK